MPQILGSGNAIVLEGTAYDQGREYGREARVAIHENLRLARRTIAMLDDRGQHFDYERALGANAAFALRDAPELIEEIHGIADGAGVPYDDLLSLNLPVFQVGLFQLRVFQPQECTQILLAAPTTVDGQTYLAKNRDTPHTQWHQSILDHRFPDGQRMLSVDVAGTITWPGSGINSDGVMLSSSGVWSGRDDFHPDRIGEGWLFLNTHLLLRHSRSVDDLVARVTAQPRLTNCLILAADGVSRIALETTADQERRFDATRGWLVRTNHFLHPEFRHLSRTPDEYPSTYHRYAVAEDRIARGYGHWDRHQLAGLLADHDGYPDKCICRHSSEGGGGQTLYGSVASLPDRSFFVMIGNPCEALRDAATGARGGPHAERLSTRG